VTAARYRWQVTGKAKDQALGCGARKFVRAHSCRRYLVKILPCSSPRAFPVPCLSYLLLSLSLAFPVTCFRNGKSRRALGGFSEKAGGY
jgi:hypothetical protein